MEEITVYDLKEKLDKNEAFFLLDVREPFEAEISSIGGTLIPLDQIPSRVDELEERKDDEVIVMCRSGSRSARAVKFLQNRGFTNIKNLKGGINEWAREVDDSLQVY